MSLITSSPFLRTTFQSALESGTTSISGSTITATNLVPNTAVKTNTNNILTSTNLEISDTNGLQTILDSTLTNPYTGTLIVNGKVQSTDAPTVANDLTKKQYVDDADNLKLDKTGGTLTGILTMDNSDINLTNGSTVQQDGVDTYQSLQVVNTSNIVTGSTAPSLTGLGNSAYGFQSLANAVGSEQNVCYGAISGYNLTSGSNNVLLGYQAGSQLIGTDLTTESDNVIIGHNTRGIGYSNSITIGSGGQASKSNQCTLHNVTEIVSDSNNTCDLGSATRQMKDLHLAGNAIVPTVPTLSTHLTNKQYVDTADNLKLNLTGGVISGNLDVTGTYSQNGILGRLPLEKGNGNNLLCDGGNLITTGNSNTGFGNGVLNTITSETHCSAFGEGAMGGSKSTYSCAMGVAALYGSGTGAGTQNNAIGVFSQRVQNNGSNNNSLGHQSLTALTDGSNNIAIGSECNASLTTESNTIAIGFNSVNLFDNSITLGHNSQSTQANQCVIHNVTEIVSGSDNTCDLGSSTRQMKDLYLAGSINGLTPMGGVYSGTSDSVDYRGDTQGTTETSILPTSSVGTLTVPANTFKQGDAFHTVLSGEVASAINQTLSIRLYGGASSTILLGQADNVFTSAVSDPSYFEIEIDWVIRNIGASGVAEIVTNFDYTYNDGNSFFGSRICSIENTNFDTTTDNTLLVTAQWSSTNASNRTQTKMMYLKKQY